MLVNRFYIALFCALEQTHCALVARDSNIFCYCSFLYCSGILPALFGCYMTGATRTAAVSAHVLCTPYSHTPVYSVIQSHTRKVLVCFAVACHLYLWHNDRDHLRATEVRLGWNGYRNKSRHQKINKLILEKKILPQLLPARTRGLSITSPTPLSHQSSPPPSPWYNNIQTHPAPSPLRRRHSVRHMHVLYECSLSGCLEIRSEMTCVMITSA